MSQPTVSVAMLAYNHEPFIAKAIEGVLQQQTDYTYELVVGEDCSTDHTRQIVSEYQKKYPDIVRLIVSEQNVGMMKNGYRTLKACRGKYLAFCEGDDYWHHPGKLQKQVDYLERHPDCTLVCSDYDLMFLDSGRRVPNYNRQEAKDPSRLDDLKYIIRGTPTSGILTCTVTTRTGMLLQVLDSDPYLYQNEQQPAGDTAMWAGMASQGSVGYIDESLATYNRHTESATRNPDKRKVLRTSIAMKEQMLYLIEKYQVADGERQRHLNDLWRRRLKLAFYEKNPDLAGEAEKQIGRLSLMERLQLWGARNPYLNAVLKPVMDTLARPLIPTGK